MKWKMIFVFLTGFMLHEFLVHLWLGYEGLLPLTSRVLLGFTITPALNTIISVLNGVLLIFCGYLGFFHPWEGQIHSERHA